MQVAKEGGLPTPSYILVIKTSPLCALQPAPAMARGPAARRTHSLLRGRAVGEHQAQRSPMRQNKTLHCHTAQNPGCHQPGAALSRSQGRAGREQLPSPALLPALFHLLLLQHPQPRSHTPRGANSARSPHSHVPTPPSQPGTGATQPWDTNPTAPGSRTARQTDSNVSTHRQLTDTAAPSPPHRDSRRSGDACAGLGAGGGSGQPSPSTRPAPADPRTEALPCPPGPRSSAAAPTACPTHAGVSMQLLAGTPQGPWAPRAAAPAPAPPAPATTSVPFTQPSSSRDARDGLSKKRQERGGRIKINDHHR